ncbi:DegT/DnrJ/EryC1/StrS family aminotransferase [Streptomyces atratus]
MAFHLAAGQSRPDSPAYATQLSLITAADRHHGQRVGQHRRGAYRAAIDLPHTDAAADQVLSLPVHPGLTTTQIDDVAQAVTTLAQAAERAA